MRSGACSTGTRSRLLTAMPRLILVADDLTGALDSAVAFAARGMETVVARGERGLKSVRHR